MDDIQATMHDRKTTKISFVVRIDGDSDEERTVTLVNENVQTWLVHQRTLSGSLNERDELYVETGPDFDP
jgi:hypothetical protein